MKNHSTFLKVAGSAMMVLLAMWLYVYAGHLDNAPEKTLLWGKLISFVNLLLALSFFIVVRKDYHDSPYSKNALVITIISTSLVTLSYLLELYTLPLQESIDVLKESNLYDYDHAEVLNAKEHTLYAVKKLSYYLMYAEGLFIAALFVICRLFSNNTRLIRAAIVVSLAIFVQYIQVYSPFISSNDEYESAIKLYQEKWMIWTMIHAVFYIASFVYLMFTYADSSKVDYEAERSLGAGDWAAVAFNVLTIVFFFRDWLYIGEGDDKYVLFSGGHSHPLIAVIFVFMALAIVSVFINRKAIRNFSAISLIVCPIVLVIVVLLYPLGESGVCLADLMTSEEFGNMFDASSINCFNFVGYIIMSIVAGIQTFYSRSSSAPAIQSVQEEPHEDQPVPQC